jgi:hypothetical protein
MRSREGTAWERARSRTGWRCPGIGPGGPNRHRGQARSYRLRRTPGEDPGWERACPRSGVRGLCGGSLAGRPVSSPGTTVRCHRGITGGAAIASKLAPTGFGVRTGKTRGGSELARERGGGAPGSGREAPHRHRERVRSHRLRWPRWVVGPGGSGLARHWRGMSPGGVSDPGGRGGCRAERCARDLCGGPRTAIAGTPSCRPRHAPGESLGWERACSRSRSDRLRRSDSTPARRCGERLDAASGPRGPIGHP